MESGQIREAARRIDGLVRRTPTQRLSVEVPSGPIEVVLKHEFTQFGGCFKARGSLNAILSARADGRLGDAGVLVASGGNAAIGAAWAARLAGTEATVVVPETAPPVKIDSLRRLGATVHQIGDHYQQAADAASRLATETGALLLHAYDQIPVAAGAGTIGLELADDVEGPLTTVACVGGGGLLAGLAATLRAGDRLVGVEPRGASCFDQARRTGAPVDVTLDSIASDSLGATRVGDICWASVADREVDSVVVDDADLIEARRRLWENLRVVVEHGTAAAVAAVLTGRVTPAPGSTLCIVLCGANTSLDL
nr:serine/threonine dehydratase [Gordonia soli]